MKRWTVALVLLSSLAWADWRPVQAGNRRYPPRYVRGSYAEYYARKKKDGATTVRQVYPGYTSNFPPPAFLYYGYPHSGDDTGIGPLGRN